MKKFLFTLSLLAITYSSKAQVPGPLATQLQNVLNNGLTNKGIHGASAHLILSGGQTWSGTAGVNGQAQPITDSTVYQAASISKLNIALVLLLMQEDSLIDLDDTWKKWLPTLNVAFDTNITVRQLLNHTSGITDYLEVPSAQAYITSNFSTFYTPQYVLENIVGSTPDFAAGTNFNYSNSNYLLAAYVAEAATPNSIRDELHNRIWDPLGMNHTYWGAYEPINDPRSGTWWNFGSGLVDYSNQSDTSMLSFGYGTDNVVTCPTDLAKLVHALVNNQVLNAQSMTEMQTWVPQSWNHWCGLYGLGMHHLIGQNVDTVIGHNGKFMNESDVFHSTLCGFTLCTMSNTYGNWEWLYNQMYDVLRNYYACNNVPVANFTGSTAACTGATVAFQDASTNWQPTTYNWSFPGGTLTGGTTVSDSMPQVIYNTPGVYPVLLIVSTSGGSDTMTKSIAINSPIASYSTAFAEGFETANLPNADWGLDNTLGQDWAVTSLGAGSGIKSLYLDNFTNPAGNNSTLMSTAFDISGFTQPKFSFKLAYQQKASGNVDKLQVLTSTDCGNTWVARLTRQGTALATVTPPSSTPLAPTSGQFNTYTVNINGVAGSTNVRFMFKFFADAAGPGNNIFLDDINLYDGAVGIQTNEAPLALEIFPNPASDQFTIASPQIIDEIRIQDVLGRLVYQSKPNEKSASLKMDMEGLYFVTVRSDSQTTTRKLIVKH